MFNRTKPKQRLSKALTWTLAGLVAVAIIGSVRLWYASLKDQARSVVVTAYSSTFFPAGSIGNRKVIAIWNDAQLSYGRASRWRIQSVGVQALGTPVVVKVRTTRNGRIYDEELQFHNGKVINFGLLEAHP